MSWSLTDYVNNLAEFLGRDELRSAPIDVDVVSHVGLDSLDFAQMLLAIEVLLPGTEVDLEPPVSIENLFALHCDLVEAGGDESRLELLIGD